MSIPSIEMVEEQLGKVRDNFKNVRDFDVEGKGLVKSLFLYSSKPTRHTLINFTLDKGKTVSREAPERDCLELMTAFNNANGIYVWYDSKNLVQQYQIYTEV